MMIQFPPPPIVAALAASLGLSEAQLRLLPGGMNQRTFALEHGGQRWVARIEQAPALSLLRAIDAKERARSAGVPVPPAVAHGQTDAEDGSYLWSIEEFVAGAVFDHDRAGAPEARAAIADLGQALRRLHSIVVDAFGDLPPRPYPVYATFAAWVSNKAARIEQAVQLAGQPPALAASTGRVYARLAKMYNGPARLSKGDCAGGNLLVARGRLAAIIDWEWAQGLDPAADLAFWCQHTSDERAHAALLDAYAPDSPMDLWRRMRAHQVVHCIETIHVFSEADTLDSQVRLQAIRQEGERLAELIRKGER